MSPWGHYGTTSPITVLTSGLMVPPVLYWTLSLPSIALLKAVNCLDNTKNLFVLKSLTP